MFGILFFPKPTYIYKYNLKKKQNECFFQIFFRGSYNICFKNPLDRAIKAAIEVKWRDYVSNFKFDNLNVSNKFYILSMFPYPSGNLHMGHVRVYTLGDVLARFYRLNGKNVLHPMGFDAFGLPAENAANENKISPEKWTYSNIRTMKSQFDSLRYCFDWDREIVTCSKEYFKFTQYLFLKLYAAGLVYRKEALVNWDPVDKTVLADEQVDSLGHSWRSGALVEKKVMEQWFIKTTKFALPLYRGLNDPKLKNWRDIIKLQKHWIGDCNGTVFQFDVMENNKKVLTLTFWTQYPESVCEAAFILVSQENILGLKSGKQIGKLQYVAVNPFNNLRLPIFKTKDLQFNEGCDVKLGIPSIYEDDEIFAKEHNIKFQKKKTAGDFDARLRICELALDADIGGYPVSSKLRDWLISRQRRWGTPIPVVHCSTCGIVPCKIEDLPIILTETGETTCPKCSGLCKQEEDTMDTFVDSSWYFLRYIDPHNITEPFSASKAKEIMPVDLYIGGKEHAILHLYYARFMSYFLHSIGLLKEPEPFRNLIVQGMVMGKTYQIKETGKYLRKESVKDIDGKLIDVDTGKEVTELWEKMSKSKFNGVEPENVINKYSVDTTRLLILSDVAPQFDRHWKADSFGGILKWEERLWTLLSNFISSKKTLNLLKRDIAEKEKELWDARNYYVKGTTFNYVVSHQLSVAISKLQGLTKILRKCDPLVMSTSLEFEIALASLLIMLYPMTPHFASELWHGFQSVPNKLDIDQKFIEWDKPVMFQKWPLLDENYNLELICKVNNVVQEKVKLPTFCLNNLSDEEALKVALSQNKVSTFIEDCDIQYFEYFVYKNYQGVINIHIDYWQKKHAQVSDKRII